MWHVAWTVGYALPSRATRACHGRSTAGYTSSSGIPPGERSARRAGPSDRARFTGPLGGIGQRSQLVTKSSAVHTRTAVQPDQRETFSQSAAGKHQLANHLDEQPRRTYRDTHPVIMPSPAAHPNDGERPAARACALCGGCVRYRAAVWGCTHRSGRAAATRGQVNGGSPMTSFERMSGVAKL